MLGKYCKGAAVYICAHFSTLRVNTNIARLTYMGRGNCFPRHYGDCQRGRPTAEALGRRDVQQLIYPSLTPEPL
jgi:hypothetical protein